jgi:hypothetical protein
VGLYFTVSNEGHGFGDVNLTPFLTSLHITMAGGTIVGTVSAELQEMPGRFSSEFDDLGQYLGKGYHLRIWHDEGGLIVYRYFGGLIVDWGETVGHDDSKTARRYRIVGTDYSAAALDDTAKGSIWRGAALPALPALTIAAGTAGSQLRAAIAAFNGGARLTIRTSGIRELSTATLPALPVRNQTFRQVCRVILANLAAAQPALKPRFYIDVSRVTSSDFDGPVFYLYDAARPDAPTGRLAYKPTTGASTLIGQVECLYKGQPPFVNRALVQNVGGAYAVASSPTWTSNRNPLNANGTWDKLILQGSTAAADLPAEAAKQAAQDSGIRREYTFSSYGRFRPGQWVTLDDPRLHGSNPHTVVMTGATLAWEQKAQATLIDGVLNTQPVLINYTAADRPPELNEDTNNGPDLNTVPALTPGNKGRNRLQASEPGYESLVAVSDYDPANPTAAQYEHAWVINGKSHPIGTHMMFATDMTKPWTAGADYAAFGILKQSGTGSEVISFTRNGTPVTAPFDGLEDDRIEVTVTGADSSTPLALTIGEQPRLVTVIA